MSEAHPDHQARARRDRKARLRILAGAFGALAIAYVLNNVLGVTLIPTEESRRSQEVRDYEARILPTREHILGYLDGKTISEIGTPGSSVAVATPILLDKNSIRGLTIRHDDHFFTFAQFTIDSGRGPCAVEVAIDHHPTDGTFAFDHLRVLKISGP